MTRTAVIAIGGNSLITDPSHMGLALAGKAGTHIVP